MAKGKLSKRQIAGTLLLSSTAIGAAASSAASAGNTLTNFLSNTKEKFGSGLNTTWEGIKGAAGKLGEKISETNIYKNYITPTASKAADFVSMYWYEMLLGTFASTFFVASLGIIIYGFYQKAKSVSNDEQPKTVESSKKLEQKDPNYENRKIKIADKIKDAKTKLEELKKGFKSKSNIKKKINEISKNFEKMLEKYDNIDTFKDLAGNFQAEFRKFEESCIDHIYNTIVKEKNEDLRKTIIEALGAMNEVSYDLDQYGSKDEYKELSKDEKDTYNIKIKAKLVKLAAEKWKGKIKDKKNINTIIKSALLLPIVRNSKDELENCNVVDKKLQNKKHIKLDKELKSLIKNFENEFAKQLEGKESGEFNQLKEIVNSRILVYSS